MAWYDGVTTWWPLKLDRLAKDRSHYFLACVAQISIRKTDDKQRRRRKREGLKKQCYSLHLEHFFAVTERLRSENAVFQSFIVDVNKWQRIFLSLFKLGFRSSGFISRRLRLYLTKWAKAWKNRDKGSKNAKLVLFYWCCRPRCHLAILDALLWGARAPAGTAFVPTCVAIGFLFLILPDFFRSSTKLLQCILHHFSRFMLQNNYILACFYNTSTSLKKCLI